MFPLCHLQVVPWSPEPLRGRESPDPVQGELLLGEEQPDLPERLLALTQVDTRAHTQLHFTDFLVFLCLY